MKHIKKFNEELSPSTYRSASVKLKKLGHVKRSQSLEDWAKEAENTDSMEKWEKNIEMYSTWGKSTFKFMLNGKEVFRGDFYLMFDFDEHSNSDNILDMKEGARGYFDFQISFSVGLIPVDDETLQKCLSSFPDKRFKNGFFWGNQVILRYKVENEKVSFNGISTYPYDVEETLEPELVDRRGALTLKRSLMDCLDEGKDYPSGIDDKKTMHDIVYRCICQKCELLVDYDVDMERILNDVKEYSHNHLFKD